MSLKRSLFIVATTTIVSFASSQAAMGQRCPGGNCPPSIRPGTSSLRDLSRSPGISNTSKGGTKGEHNKTDECPPGTDQPPQNCDDVRRIAYKLAAKKGYQMSGNAPTVMTRRYVRGFNDCSTGNAHVACMFNDSCTAPHGELLGLRSRSAYHATTLWKGKDGSQFECDFTPDSSGIFIANRGDTKVGPAFPDPGESIDPAYDCEKNGASSSALNPGMFGGGGGGGSLQDMAILGALMSLLNGQQNGQQDGSQPENPAQPSPPPNLEEEKPVVVLTPTPTPTAVQTADPKATKIPAADSGIVSSDRSVPTDTSESSTDADDEENIETPAPNNGTKDDRPNAVWEERRGSMF